ncbi:hypothetical protein G5714_007642 [Onychostoma macrolepis]|uniref:Parathyroid hormone n=2 Tax=Onychostoma macrolepis TaxID=369639 RepID=A0A7J6CU11_9TELE|nr:hypothetical protein G5714_007642 [Onychostoma macrolepis]
MALPAAVQLLCLEQMDRSLEDHTRDFLDLACLTHFPDRSLGVFYITSLSEQCITMLPIRSLEKIMLIIVLWGLCSLLYLEGLPISKRSISEVQLMHNVREHKEMLERQDWLQLKLNNILIPSINDSQKEQKGKTNGPSIRRLRKEEGAACILN